MNTELYFLRSSEHFIVKELLHYAASLDELEETLDAHPALEQYHRNYGNFNGDIGVYALVENRVAGGAWVRMLLNGHGHVDLNTPELSFAVLPEYRNRGLGTKIIEQLMREVAKIFTQVSLCVHEDNPAIHLYERVGFIKIDGSEQTGSAGSISFTMLKVFDEQTKDEPAERSLEEERFRKSFSF